MRARRSRVGEQPSQRARERVRVARRHEQPGLAVGDDLGRPADRRRDDRPPARHRLEHDERQALRPRRERDDVGSARSGRRRRGSRRRRRGRATPSRSASPRSSCSYAPPCSRSRPTRTARAGKARDASISSRWPFTSQSRPTSPTSGASSAIPSSARTPSPVGAPSSVDAVVDDLDPPRVALPLVRAPRVLGDGDELAARRAVALSSAARTGRVGRRKWFSMCRCETTARAREARREPAERVRGRERVRVQDVDPLRAQESREPHASRRGGTRGRGPRTRPRSPRCGPARRTGRCAARRTRRRRRAPAPRARAGARRAGRRRRRRRSGGARSSAGRRRRARSRRRRRPRSITTSSVVSSSIGAVPDESRSAADEARGAAGRARRGAGAAGAGASAAGAARRARRRRSACAGAARSRPRRTRARGTGSRPRSVGSRAASRRQQRRPGAGRGAPRARTGPARGGARSVSNEQTTSKLASSSGSVLDVRHRELDVRRRVPLARVRDRLRVAVDADDASRDSGEVRAAVADAAAGVEHVAPVAERERELVALQVERDDPGLGLVRDDPLEERSQHGKYPCARLARSPSRCLARAGGPARVVTVVVLAVLAAARSCPGSPLRRRFAGPRWPRCSRWLRCGRGASASSSPRPAAGAASRLSSGLRSSRPPGRRRRGRRSRTRSRSAPCSPSRRCSRMRRRAGRRPSRPSRPARRRRRRGRGRRAARARVPLRPCGPGRDHRSPARYQGLGGGPNTATMVLAVAIPLAAYFTAVRADTPWAGARRRRPGRCSLRSRSGSRGALVAAFTGLLVFALAGFPFPRRAAGAAVAVGVVLAATLALVAVPSRASANPPEPTGVDPTRRA